MDYTSPDRNTAATAHPLDTANGGAHLAQCGCVVLAATHYARDHVAMATQELGGAVHHVGGAERRGLLQHRRGEGGIDQHRHVAGGRHDGADVHQVQRRVGRGFDDHQRGVGAPARGAQAQDCAARTCGRCPTARRLALSLPADVARACGTTRPARSVPRACPVAIATRTPARMQSGPGLPRGAAVGAQHHRGRPGNLRAP